MCSIIPNMCIYNVEILYIGNVEMRKASRRYCTVCIKRAAEQKILGMICTAKFLKNC